MNCYPIPFLLLSHFFPLQTSSENEPDFFSITPCYDNLNDAKCVEEKTAVTVATTTPSSAKVVHVGPSKTDDKESS
jgi:hypothetical protein